MASQGREILQFLLFTNSKANIPPHSFEVFSTRILGKNTLDFAAHILALDPAPTHTGRYVLRLGRIHSIAVQVRAV